MTKDTRTKEELLVENAILKYNEQVRKMLKEELSPLTKRVDNIDTRLKEVEEIVEPFGIIRRRFWIVLIAVALGSSVAGSKIADYIGNITR